MYFPKNVDCMMGAADHILPFAGGQAISEPDGIHRVVHRVDGLAYMVREAVRRDEMELRDRKRAAQQIDVLPTVQLENILRLGMRLEALGVKHPLLDAAKDIPPDEAILQNGRVAHTIGRENDAAPLRDADGLGQRRRLVAAREQVVHRTEKQRDVVGLVREGRQVPCVALPDRDRLACGGIPPEKLDVMLGQLDCVHAEAAPRERVAVPAGSRADFQNAHARLCISLDVRHRDGELDRAMAGGEAAVLVVGVVKRLYIRFGIHFRSSHPFFAE